MAGYHKSKTKTEERIIRKKPKIIIILIISILVLLFYKPVETAILKHLYPCKYSEYVEKYAKEYNIDHLLIYSIIKAESNFEPQSTSTSGAKGLMQLMEKTAEEVAENTLIEYKHDETIYNIETNIMLGTKYFAQLLENYNGNIYLSLAAYNAGMGNVAKWIEQGIIKEDGSDIENIPFKETNQYVRKIIRNYRIYQEVYMSQ